MKSGHNVARLLAAGLAIVALTACTTYDRRADNTLLGAGLGTAAGAVVSGGDPLYMLGGAAAGGLLGNVLTSDNRGYRRSSGWDRHYDNHSSWRDDRRRDRRDWRRDRNDFNDHHRDRSDDRDHRSQNWDSRRGINRDFPVGGYGYSSGSNANNH